MAVREVLANPPVIVLAQGPMQPWGLLGPEFETERQSLASTNSGGSAIVVEPSTAVSPLLVIVVTGIKRLTKTRLDLPAVVSTSGSEGRHGRERYRGHPSCTFLPHGWHHPRDRTLDRSERQFFLICSRQ
jgi:hypothetical protein